MFRKIYGIAILCAALFFITGLAHAKSYPCTAIKSATGAMARACDVTFTVLPSFADVCLLTVESGVFTIHNNTPVGILINYIRIQNNDALPAAATAIVATPTNSCVAGKVLAAGASCNIQVNLIPLAVGTFNRVLQVGINTRQVQLDASIMASAVSCVVPTPGFPLAPFTDASACTVLGGSTVTNAGPSAVNGNVCVAPGTAITGFPPGIIANGTTHSDDALAIAAQADLTTAYNFLVAQPCGTVLTGQDLGTVGPLSPGVYCFSSGAQLTGALVLSGAGRYIFQIGSTLNTAPNSAVTLTNGATNDNVFWQVGSSATLGTGTQFQGVIAAEASITIQTGAQLFGYALARTAAVTLDSNIVNPAL